MSSGQSNLRRDLATAFALFVAPLAVALLPRRIGFALASRLADLGWVHREAAAAASREASAWIAIEDPARWQRNLRLLCLVDDVDAFRFLFFPRAPLAPRIVVEPSHALDLPGAFFSLHFGAALPLLAELTRRHGGVALAPWRPTAADFGGDRVRFAHARWRYRATVRACGGAVLEGDSAGEAFREALAAGRPALRFLDPPMAASRERICVEVAGLRVGLAAGLLRRAQSMRRRAVAFVSELDPDTGARAIRCLEIPDGPTTADALGRFFSAPVGSASWAWRAWGAVPELVRAAGGSPAAPTGASGEPRQPSAVLVQLFWRAAGDAFKEAHSARAFAPLSPGRHVVRFEVHHAADLARLRLDPADRPGFVRLHELRLFARDGSLVESRPLSPADFPATRGVVLAPTAPSADGMMVAMLDPDPQLELGFRPGTPARLFPRFSVEVDLSWATERDMAALSAGLRGVAALGQAGARPAACAEVKA